MIRERLVSALTRAAAGAERIRSESGAAFDARCVQALEQVISRPEAQTQEADAATDEVVKPPAVRQTVPLLPSIPTVYASDPGRIVR